ncbi:hypothetical protein [Parerythrobacter jejuensis]|uniref:Uncharacterized protein n=1 Tax=Parerythrobacter jejuensis TaxID=795812 RepID=A0A845AN11_9SPHN|nr:hypothetical protein [Parerythrobacter jejuensis]MXP32202.1 hypothetical protein [Parerythrobacter jejuensis]
MSLALLIAASLASAPQDWDIATGVPIFQREQITPDVSVFAFGIIEDSRCVDPEFCFRNNELRVAAVVNYRGRESEVVLELGKPLAIGPGTLTLLSAGTPANPNGAIRLKKYRLNMVYRPAR